MDSENFGNCTNMKFNTSASIPMNVTLSYSGQLKLDFLRIYFNNHRYADCKTSDMTANKTLDCFNDTSVPDAVETSCE